jgi:hypothetical protein
MPPPTIRTVEQPTLFGAAQAEGLRDENDARSPTCRISAGARGGGQEAEQSNPQGAAFSALSPLSNMPLREVCAYCGKEIQLPGFVIPDFEDLGAFCNGACGDRRFRLFLDGGPD